MALTTLSPELYNQLRRALAPMSDDEVSRFIASGEVVRLAAGQTLFSRDTAADELFFILSGQLSVIKESGIGRKGQVVALLQPFAPVGEGCVSGQRRHGATVRTTEETVLLRFEQNRLEKMQVEHPVVVVKLLAHLLIAASKRLEKCSDRLVHVL